MKMKPFCFHKTEGANNHIKHVARNPISLTYYLRTAMFTTSVIHNWVSLANRMPYQTIVVSNAPNREIRSLRGLGRHFFTKQEITVTVMMQEIPDVV